MDTDNNKKQIIGKDTVVLNEMIQPIENEIIRKEIIEKKEVANNNKNSDKKEEKVKQPLKGIRSWWTIWKDKYDRWSGVKGRMGVQDWQHDDISTAREITRDTLFGKSVSSHHQGGTDHAHIRESNMRRPTYERYPDEDVVMVKGVGDDVSVSNTTSQEEIKAPTGTAAK